MTALVVERLLHLDGPRTAFSSTSADKKLSPALYHPTPLPSPSPSPPSSSPYIVNRLQTYRPPGRSFTFRPSSPGTDGKPDELSSTTKENTETTIRQALASTDAVSRPNLEEEEDSYEKEGNRDTKIVVEDFDASFSSPLQTSAASGCNNAAGFQNRFSVSIHTEFYDAVEDFSVDGSIKQSFPSFSTKNENELYALRLNILEGIEKRKMAEAALLHMQNQWKKLSGSLSQIGVVFPLIQHVEEGQVEFDAALLCGDIVAKSSVSEDIEKILVPDAAEKSMVSVLNSKNHEVSRLRDRLRYYETVNHEMSRRNMENAELDGNQHQKRKKRWRWVWGCIGLTVSIGASLLVFSHMQPQQQCCCMEEADSTISSTLGQQSDTDY